MGLHLVLLRAPAPIKLPVHPPAKCFLRLNRNKSLNAINRPPLRSATSEVESSHTGGGVVVSKGRWWARIYAGGPACEPGKWRWEGPRSHLEVDCGGLGEIEECSTGPVSHRCFCEYSWGWVRYVVRGLFLEAVLSSKISLSKFHYSSITLNLLLHT